jgi:hypothetical protein
MTPPFFLLVCQVYNKEYCPLHKPRDESLKSKNETETQFDTLARDFKPYASPHSSPLSSTRTIASTSSSSSIIQHDTDIVNTGMKISRKIPGGNMASMISSDVDLGVNISGHMERASTPADIEERIQSTLAAERIASSREQIASSRLKEMEQDARTLQSMFEYFPPLCGVGHICEVTYKFLWGCPQMEAMLGGPCLNHSPTDFLEVNQKSALLSGTALSLLDNLLL